MKWGKKENEIAAKLKAGGKNSVNAISVTDTRAFCQTKEWKELRQFVLAWYGRRCMRCGSSWSRGNRICVDHIKPRKTHPSLALEFSNLQVLCAKCNKRKGNLHSKDYRK